MVGSGRCKHRCCKDFDSRKHEYKKQVNPCSYPRMKQISHCISSMRKAENLMSKERSRKAMNTAEKTVEKKGCSCDEICKWLHFFRFQDISWNFRGGFHHHIGHHHINTQLAASQMVRTQHSVMDTLTKQFHCDLQSRPCTITAVQFTVMMCCDVLLWWWLSSHLYSLHFAAPSSFWKSGKRSLGFKTSFDK
jgi:hypothetical protein